MQEIAKSSIWDNTLRAILDEWGAANWQEMDQYKELYLIENSYHLGSNFVGCFGPMRAN